MDEGKIEQAMDELLQSASSSNWSLLVLHHFRRISVNNILLDESISQCFETAIERMHRERGWLRRENKDIYKVT